jgi:hypothetical protein
MNEKMVRATFLPSFLFPNKKSNHNLSELRGEHWRQKAKEE